MTEPLQKKSARATYFGLSLLAIPALLLWMYLSPAKHERAEPSFEALQDTSISKTPLEQMEDMWEHHPGHGPIALELANLYLEDGQYENGLKFYRVFLESDTSAGGWETRLDVSRALHALGRNDEAVAELKEMLKRQPDHPGALYNLGAIEANAGRSSEAKAAWEKLIATHPDDTLAQFAKAALPKLTKPANHP